MDSPTVISSPQPITPARRPAPQPPEIIARLRGERLEHFVLDDYIGVGGMGAVFLARDVRLDRPVALKVLPQTPDLDPDLIQRFENEARAAARLDHENIARVYYVGEDRGVHFIAFEYVEGTNLRDLIEQTGRLPLAEAVNYTLQIAGALVHAASRDVVHRDVKPSNIIITPAGRAKLVDMGLARRFETDYDGGVTQSGVTLGTFDYISPEQARDPRTADVRSDIYSLGCTLYHMLTGQPPFPEGTIAQKLLAHQADEPPSPQARNPQIPDDLAAVVAKMMAKQPRRRYRDPEQLYRDLLLVAGALGLRSTSPEGLVWMSPTRPHVPAWERQAPLVIPVVTLLAVALVLFIWPPGFVAAPEAEIEGLGPLAKATSPATPDADVQRGADAERFETGGARTSAVLENPGALAQRPAPDEFNAPAGRGDPAATPRDLYDEPERSHFDRGHAAERPAAGEPLESPRSPQRQAPEAAKVAGEPPLPKTPAVSGGVAPEIAGGGVRADRALDGTASSTQPAPYGTATRGPQTSDLQTATVDERAEIDISRPSPEPARTRRPAEDRSPAIDALPPVEPMAFAERPNTLVVDPLGGERVYKTIQDALEAAASDSASIIELRYNGRRREEPFKINGIRVTLRPAEGFKPIVVLAPKEIPTQGFRTQLISVAGGSLSLVDLDLELRIPAGGDSWSLFHVQNAEKLSLTGCTATLENPYGQNAALVEVGSVSASGASLTTTSGDLPPGPIELDIRDSFLRAEADLVLVREPQAVRLNLANDVVASTGALLHVRGGTQSRSGEYLELRAEHVSARSDGGLVLLEATESAQSLIALRMTTSNNIFRTQSLSPDDSPLIKIVGPRDVVSLGELVQDDRSVGVNNFYEGYQVFREIRSDTGNMFMMSSGKSTWEFEAWQSSRGSQESQPRQNQVRWAVAPGVVSPAEVTLRDWALADRPNPALDGTSDGAPAGANLEEIPEPPANAGS
jgi:serine/threonine-protein kinase